MAERALTPEAVVAAVREVVGPGPKRLHAPFITDDDKDEVRRQLDVDPVGHEAVEALERAAAEACGARYAVAVSSGTAALHLAMLVAGVGDGDYVQLPDLNFVAAAAAVRYCRARPIFGPAAHFNRSPKAAVFVHLLGMPERPPKVKDAVIIEDAAEALGSAYKGKPAGSLGDLSILSFNANKIVTTGGGGMILTESAIYVHTLRDLSTTAKVPRPFYFEHSAVGYNYRMANISAALGLQQMRRLPQIIDRKRALAARYAAAFEGLAHVWREDAGSRSNYWLNAITVPSTLRQATLEALAADGLECRALFTPMHALPPYANFDVEPVEAQIATREYQTTICLPSGSDCA